MVAKEFKWLAKKEGRAALFAGTPPVECLRLLLSELTTMDGEGESRGREEGEEPKEMMILDVRRAHFYARALRRMFIQMPEEDPRLQECQGVNELIIPLYGTQDAVAN